MLPRPEFFAPELQIINSIINYILSSLDRTPGTLPGEGERRLDGVQRGDDAVRGGDRFHCDVMHARDEALDIKGHSSHSELLASALRCYIKRTIGKSETDP